MRKVKAFVPFLRNIYKVLKSDGYYRGWHTERERERERESRRYFRLLIQCRLRFML